MQHVVQQHRHSAACRPPHIRATARLVRVPAPRHRRLLQPSAARPGVRAASVFDKLKGIFSPSGEDAQAQAQREEDRLPGDEEGTMRRLEEDAEPFGPAAVLLIGFPSPGEVEAFRSMMLEMEADMFKIIPCSRAQLDGTLQQALEADCPAWQAPPLGLRRVIVLSGMWGGEIAEVIAAYKASGGAPAVFAAAVPNNMSRVVRELVDDVTAEDAAMKRAVAEEDLEA